MSEIRSNINNWIISTFDTVEFEENKIEFVNKSKLCIYEFQIPAWIVRLVVLRKLFLEKKACTVGERCLLSQEDSNNKIYKKIANW